jgi:hypothetical protein
MTRHRWLSGACLLIASAGLPRAGRAQEPGGVALHSHVQSSRHGVYVPEHLQLGNQTFEASVAGLRSYLETTRSSDLGLYQQLQPDVAGLEDKQTTAEIALVGGLAAGAATMVYGFASNNTCTAPTVSDPNFAADSAAWGDCNDRNMTKQMTFAFLGAGIAVAGGILAWAIWPSRQDFLDVVNKHNRLSPHPLQLQLGYDPTQRFAFSGATVTF